MKIDYKKLLNMFKDKYDEISHFNKHDYEIYKEYLYQFDKLIDDEIEFAKLAHKFEDSVNDAFSDRYCLALMFALEELGLLDAIESGRIEEKSLKESINGDCYIYYDDDDSKRLVFCDYVKGITDTSDWFYLDEYIIDAIHVFKNEKQAQKFIDEHLKYFADQDKVVIAEYPQTVSGFFESKESVKKSIKEERYNVELSDYSGSIVDEDTFDKKSDAIQWANDNGRNCYARIWDNEEGKTVKEWKVKSIKESADDSWYKLKMLNEMLDAMEEDEYNIPKLGIYGVTKNINLDKGAIEALIKYYK